MKKLISLALAAAMSLSFVSPLSTLVYAEELPQATQTEQDVATDENADPDAEPAAEDENDTPAATAPVQSAPAQAPAAPQQDAPQDDAVAQAAALFTALPTADEAAAMSAGDLQAVMEQTTEALNAFDALSLEDSEAFLAEYGALYEAVANDLMAVLLSADDKDASDLSLQPMEQTDDVYLTLSGYTVDELKNFPVDDIPDMLTDAMGNPLEIDDSYTGAWFYFVDDDVDESHTLGAGETVDLWDYTYTAEEYDYYQIYTTYNLCLVLGDGGQMNDGNSHRYLIEVELFNSDTVSYFYMYPSLNRDGDKSYNPTLIRYGDFDFQALGMQGFSYIYYEAEFDQYKDTYKVWVNQNSLSEDLARRGIKMDFYKMADFLRYRDEGQPLTGAITADVIGDGYAAAYDTQVTQDNYMDADNLWAIVFTNKDTGRVLGYLGYCLNIQKIEKAIEANLLFYNGTEMETLRTARVNGVSDRVNMGVGLSNNVPGSNGAFISDTVKSYSCGVGFSMPEGYPTDETYYVTLPQNDMIKKVYAGSYLSEEDAINAGAADITDEVFSDGSGEAPYGHPVTLGNYNDQMTLVLQDGTVLAQLYFYGYSTGSGSSDSARNDLDPNFQITGATGPNGFYLSNYVADMANGIQLDTYYRRDDRYDVGGYQLILLNKEISDDELKQIVPRFWTPEGVQVHSGGKVVSGETSLEHATWNTEMANTVLYQVQVPGEKLRNYQVTFATRQQGPKMLVAGPDERFVNLTADNNFVHDIMVANIGDEDLTGITVELKNAVHVKLDDYWTLGGAGNDTLPAFDETYVSYPTVDEDGNQTWDYNTYATLDNIAKVRLLADGEGEISGTLVITAANGDKREIKLTGIAANPKIVSATLDDAVKFVPYSYMVVTDNMYRWNNSTFTLVDGALPRGMMLYENTGEIYGVPQESGDFTFTVRVDYSSSRFSPSQATYTLHVEDNTNQAVYNETDEGYIIETPLGVEQGAGTRDFYLADTSTDQLYVSQGEYGEFIAVWLNGRRLIPGVDYLSESGSTRITIRSQTFAQKAYTDRYNTIAVEFRVGGSLDNELKRTAQNFRLTADLLPDGSGSSGGSSSGGGSGSGSSGSSGGSQNAAQNAGQNAGQSAGASAQGAAGSAAQAAQGASGVTLRFHVVDAQGGPIVGASAELHSTPRYGTTDGNGDVVFSGVEFGEHTLTIYNADGGVMGGKTFTLAHGGFGINGSVITVSDGALVDIRVIAADGTLKFNAVDLAQPAAIPQTGDDFDPTLWRVTAVLAFCLAAGLTVYKKKKEQA